MSSTKVPEPHKDSRRRHFQISVDVTGDGPWPPVLLVDASDSTIEVTFPKGEWMPVLPIAPSRRMQSPIGSEQGSSGRNVRLAATRKSREEN